MLNRIFPQTADNSYTGNKIALYMFMILSFISMGRSLVHFLAPDGGAGSIAGIDLSQGGESIIFAFGLWGLSQVIYAFVQLLVAFCYRTLIPLFYIILIFETLGRMLIGAIKPPILFHTPPGEIANYIILPLAVIMFVLSLVKTKTILQKRRTK